MKSWITLIVFAFFCVTGAASAQQSGEEVVWIQIEAHPSLREAQSRAQTISGSLHDVNGFALGGSWYGVMLGPYRRTDAQTVLETFRAQRLIPQDSFIAFTQNLGQQFWPVGANVLNSTATLPQVTQTETPPQTDAPTPQASDETRAEARNSERLLSRDERKDLQIALQAAGYYDSAIDGAFGPGTRGSMKNWQTAYGYEATGILTTLQRQALMDQYNAPLISVGMRSILDRKAGIEMQIPAKLVKFSRYEPPFAHYDSIDNSKAKVLLISQPGTKATLFGLYDIMQTLEIVPLEGPRERGKDRFTLVGRGNGIVSYTEARLENEQIKGFTLVWPTGDEERRQRVLAEMRASFKRVDGVLDPAAGANAEQRIDLISGLEIRKPRLSRSGFYTDQEGTVITVAEAVQDCTRITLDQEYRAKVVAKNAALGIAVLRPVNNLAPISVAEFRTSDPRLKSDIAVSGYAYEGILGAPTLTFGTVSDIKGLRGETELARLALAAQPGDAGGPVFDTAGSVMGMLLPQAQNGQQLPGDVSFAADSEAIRAILDQAGLSAQDSGAAGSIAAADLSRRATGMTVLVSCWN